MTAFFQHVNSVSNPVEGGFRQLCKPFLTSDFFPTRELEDIFGKPPD